MYCPNCGKQNSEAQNFCRSCGLGLEKIAQSLTEQLPSVTVRSLQERKERLQRFGMASLSVFGVSILGFFAYNLFYKLMISQGIFVAALAVLGVLIFLGSGLLSVILFAKAEELKETPASRQIEAPNQTVTDVSTGGLLDSHEQPALSITEHTTNLLETPSTSGPRPGGD